MSVRRLLAARHARPSLDFRTRPVLAAATATVNYGSGHVWISGLVDADGGGVTKPQQIGDLSGVDQVVNVDLAAHIRSLAEKLTYLYDLM